MYLVGRPVRVGYLSPLLGCVLAGLRYGGHVDKIIILGQAARLKAIKCSVEKDPISMIFNKHR